MKDKYQPSWDSLCAHVTPQWLKDAKFGIYTHWGVYCVPARGPNATWYPYNMYRPGTEQYEYHVKTYGGPEKFGYKDFIPEFTGAKFDANEWAELFKQAGARFAGPVGEHHDGFTMWDTQYSEWNAVKMGPKRDVVGELAKAMRAQGMKYMIALHHAENWWFYPHHITAYDTADPRYAGLYGEPHDLGGIPERQLRHEEWWDFERPSQKFLEKWKNKTLEAIDRYQPDLLWFDFGLRFVQEKYKKEFLAYYFNRAEEWGKEVVVTYKWHDLVPGSGVIDLELGRFDTLTYMDWITDTTVDAGHGWGYLKDTLYKSPQNLIHYLIDNVSKNGYMLLNVGPRPDGSIPEEAQAILHAIGRWLTVNGEAIYGTTPWMIYGEGPTQMTKAGYFMEDQEVQYTSQDFRFTVKGDTLYAICLGWPAQEFTIPALYKLWPNEIQSIQLLGHKHELAWQWTPKGVKIVRPAEKPCEHAYVFKIQRGQPYK
jgi:alpha-L-fucosidase